MKQKPNNKEQPIRILYLENDPRDFEMVQHQFESERFDAILRRVETREQFLDFVHPDDLTSTREAVSRLASQKEVLNFENRYRCKDGTYRWIEWRSYPEGNAIFAVARDITKRKQAEEEITMINQELQSLNRVILNANRSLHLQDQREIIMDEALGVGSDRTGKTL
ncbi:MAG: PAS domain-containing protein [bacterium]